MKQSSFIVDVLVQVMKISVENNCLPLALLLEAMTLDQEEIMIDRTLHESFIECMNHRMDACLKVMDIQNNG